MVVEAAYTAEEVVSVIDASGASGVSGAIEVVGGGVMVEGGG